MESKFLIVLLTFAIFGSVTFLLNSTCVNLTDWKQYHISVSNRNDLDKTNKLKGIDLSHHNSGIIKIISSKIQINLNQQNYFVTLHCKRK